MSCQAGPGYEPGPSALKAGALPIELTSGGITAQLILEHFGQVIFALSSCHKSLGEKLGINMNDFVSNIDAVAEGEYLVFFLECGLCCGFPCYPFQYLLANLLCTVTIHCRISCDP